jgi:hypothetical protein
MYLIEAELFDNYIELLSCNIFVSCNPTTPNGTSKSTTGQERRHYGKGQGTNNASAYPSYYYTTASWQKDQKVYF